MPLRVAAPTFCNSRHVGLGSWSCENAKTRDHDRRSYSSETALALNRASAFNLTNELKNAILAAFRSFAFLHTQGHLRTHALQQIASVTISSWPTVSLPNSSGTQAPIVTTAATVPKNMVGDPV
jgi:hypothetical protein